MKYILLRLRNAATTSKERLYWWECSFSKVTTRVTKFMSMDTTNTHVLIYPFLKTNECIFDIRNNIFSIFFTHFSTKTTVAEMLEWYSPFMPKHFNFRVLFQFVWPFCVMFDLDLLLNVCLDRFNIYIHK